MNSSGLIPVKWRLTFYTLPAMKSRSVIFSYRLRHRRSRRATNDALGGGGNLIFRVFLLCLADISAENIYSQIDERQVK